MSKEIIDAPVIEKLSGGEFDKFANLVVEELISDNVPPTPANYSIYFDKMLDSRPMAFRKRVREMISSEKEEQLDRVAVVEQDVKQTFVNIKQLVNSIAIIYKSITAIEHLIRKKIEDLGIATGTLAVQNILRALDADMNKLTAALDHQLIGIKASYEEISKIYKRVSEQSEFDSKYDVFNRRYLQNTAEAMLEDIKRFDYSNSLMFVRVKDSLLRTINLQKDRDLLVRNVAKLLLKTSRRSDVVAHYGDGIFVFAMKHTNIVNAKKACERISDLLYNTTFFINDKEIDMDVEMSVLALNTSDIEAQFKLGVDALSSTGKGHEAYAVVGEDIIDE